MKNEELKDVYKSLDELKLKVQILETQLQELKEGSFGTGIYLDGCSEATKDYISQKKVGD